MVLLNEQMFSLFELKQSKLYVLNLYWLQKGCEIPVVAKFSGGPNLLPRWWLLPEVFNIGFFVALTSLTPIILSAALCWHMCREAQQTGNLRLNL